MTVLAQKGILKPNESPRTLIMKLPLIVALLFTSYNAAASFEPGDINLYLQRTDQNSYKYRLVINNSDATPPTPCINPDSPSTSTFSYGAIGSSKARVVVQAQNCNLDIEQWITLKGVVDYDSNYWFDVYLDRIDKSIYA